MTFSGKTFLALDLNIKRYTNTFSNKAVFIWNVPFQKSFLGLNISLELFFSPNFSKKPFLPTIETLMLSRGRYRWIINTN